MLITLHADRRVRNLGINDPMSPPLLIYDGIKVYHIDNILMYSVYHFNYILLLDQNSQIEIMKYVVLIMTLYEHEIHVMVTELTL